MHKKYDTTVTAIAINFMDNDFVCTFVPILEHLHTLGYVPSKKQLVYFINEVSFGFYCAHQRLFDNLDSNRINDIKNCLQITEDNIYIDEEVVTWITRNNFNNSCWYTYLGSEDHTVYHA